MKPSLFLSHSSVDAEPIARLKKLLNTATGGTLDIFVSSDGQSIPFGRNWVHEVEEALRHAKLMFVFLSPAALGSRWIPFEAGFAYGIGIQVVPVGIYGVDLAQVGAPLSLLQGFNLSSAPGMNNILSIVNRVFSFSFREDWQSAHFDEVFVQGQVRATSLLEPYTHLISGIAFHAACEHTPESDAVAEFLLKNQFQPFKSERSLYASGISLPLHKGRVSVKVDPLVSSLVFPLLDGLLPFLSEANVASGVRFELTLARPVRAIDAIHKLSARVLGTDFELSSNQELRLGDLSLRLHQRQIAESHSTASAAMRIAMPIEVKTRPGSASISFTYAGRRLADAPIARALAILFRVGALYLDGDDA